MGKKPGTPKELVEPIDVSKLPPDLPPETLAIIERINQGIKELAAGKTMSADEVLDDLKKTVEKVFDRRNNSRLGKHPVMSKIKINYDPTEDMSEEEF